MLIRAIYLLYRWILSPMLHALAGPGYGCRFDPSCSRYAEESLRNHGIWRGSILALRRISRCRPGGGFGPDPVPAAPRRTLE